MIAKDMKYTALYWALRFIEYDLDVHVKLYGDYKITIYAEKQSVDYGDRIKVIDPGLNRLVRHKDFVILECVDRLLSNGVLPEQIVLDGRSGQPDVIANDKRYCCQQWGNDFETARSSFDVNSGILYTSRLVSGLLEFKTFERTTVTPSPICSANDDFDIVGDELVSYKGKDKKVVVPKGIKTIGASAFWNNTFVEEVVLPDSLERLGGDCFYYCSNLKKVNIPSKVRIMGNNPFAGCPELVLENESSFILENGVLYSPDKTNLIYYPINKKEKEFNIPYGVTCLGKHCFYACDELERITVPETVTKFENNPFSGCTKLRLENKSAFYHVIDGVIYNKFMTTVVGCLNGTTADEIVLPDTVTAINRNSFWSCKGIKKLIISKNVDRIGYNPFASCENMLIESKSPNFISDGGVLYDKSKTHLLCATDRAVGKRFRVPDGVTHINRGVFSGCASLEEIDLNDVVYIDKNSFTNCVSLKKLYIPDGVTYVGEWVFAYCKNLKKISVGKNTYIDKNALNECPAAIERRVI